MPALLLPPTLLNKLSLKTGNAKVKDSYSIKIGCSSKILEKVYGLLYSFDILGLEESENNNDVELSCFYETEEICKEVINLLKKSNLKIQTEDFEKVLNRDWNENWRKTMEPVKVADKVWISPEWLPPKIKDGEVWIKIEPKMAFGTGHHETTRLASKSIISTFTKTSKRILDIGTGSGILCFISDLIGYEYSLGLEIDPDCRQNIFENQELNPAKSRVDFIISKIDALKKNSFDTIVMNMIRLRSEPLLKYCYDILNKNGTLIWTGILVEESDLCIKESIRIGWKIKTELIEGEWWSAILMK